MGGVHDGWVVVIKLLILMLFRAYFPLPSCSEWGLLLNLFMVVFLDGLALMHVLGIRVEIKLVIRDLANHG